MVVVNVRKALNGMNIMSQEKTWEILLNNLGDTINDENETYLLDFTNVSVSSATSHPSFKKLIRRPNIRMKFVNSEDLIHSIRMLCILDSIPYIDRFENVNTPKPVEKTAAELKIEKNGENILSKFNVDEDNKTATFEVIKYYRQLYNTDTCIYLKYAIGKLKDNGIKKVIIDMKGVLTNVTVLSSMCSFCKDFASKGVEILFDIDDEDTAKDFKLCMYKSQKDSYTPAVRAKTINAFYNKYGDTAGLLVKYEKSRTPDEFGRFGKGQVASCKVCVFRGVKKMGDKYFMVVETFAVNEFMTIAQYYSTHDGETQKKLKSETVCIDVADVGFLDCFIGPHYHFLMPVQRHSSETKRIPIEFNEKGNNVIKDCTLPERIMYVFRDYDIKCNMELLNRAIAESEKNR